MTDSEPDKAYRFLELSQLQTLADTPDVLETMLQTIAASLSEDLALLQKLINAQDVQSVGLKLHALKGYIPMVSQPSLGEHLAQLEDAVRHPSGNTATLWSAPQLPALMLALNTLLQEVQSAIQP